MLLAILFGVVVVLALFSIGHKIESDRKFEVIRTIIIEVEVANVKKLGELRKIIDYQRDKGGF